MDSTSGDSESLFRNQKPAMTAMADGVAATSLASRQDRVTRVAAGIPQEPRSKHRPRSALRAIGSDPPRDGSPTARANGISGPYRPEQHSRTQCQGRRRENLNPARTFPEKHHPKHHGKEPREKPVAVRLATFERLLELPSLFHRIARPGFTGFLHDAIRSELTTIASHTSRNATTAAHLTSFPAHAEECSYQRRRAPLPGRHTPGA